LRLLNRAPPRGSTRGLPACRPRLRPPRCGRRPHQERQPPEPGLARLDRLAADQRRICRLIERVQRYEAPVPKRPCNLGISGR